MAKLLWPVLGGIAVDYITFCQESHASEAKLWADYPQISTRLAQIHTWQVYCNGE